MFTAVVAITDEQRAPKAREARLLRRVQESYRWLCEQIAQYEDSNALMNALERYQMAGIDTHLYWERRALKAERT